MTREPRCYTIDFEDGGRGCRQRIKEMLPSMLEKTNKFSPRASGECVALSMSRVYPSESDFKFLTSRTVR